MVVLFNLIVRPRRPVVEKFSGRFDHLEGLDKIVINVVPGLIFVSSGYCTLIYRLDTNRPSDGLNLHGVTNFPLLEKNHPFAIDLGVAVNNKYLVMHYQARGAKTL